MSRLLLVNPDTTSNRVVAGLLVIMPVIDASQPIAVCLHAMHTCKSKLDALSRTLTTR